jgi:hypothetical protein
VRILAIGTPTSLRVIARIEDEENMNVNRNLHEFCNATEDLSALLPWSAGWHCDLDVGQVFGTNGYEGGMKGKWKEALYAIETLLRWKGIKLVPEGKDNLKVTRVQED